MPSFKGNVNAWLAQNIQYPAVAAENGVQGKVIVRSVVGKDGSVSQASVVRSVDPPLDREALRAVNSMPRWNPGMNNGQPAAVWFTLPVTFKLSKYFSIMKRPIFYILVGLVLTFCALHLLRGEAATKGVEQIRRRQVMAFASDESFSPIIEEEREMFQDMYPEAKLKPIYTNEYDEVDMLMRGKIFLAITSRDFTPKQLKYLQDNNFQPTAIKLAYDALALIVNKNNNDTCISVKDVKRILSGEVTDWSQIYPGSRLWKDKDCVRQS